MLKLKDLKIINHEDGGKTLRNYHYLLFFNCLF